MPYFYRGLGEVLIWGDKHTGKIWCTAGAKLHL